MAQKSLNQIRETFLKYFEKNDHKIVESSNLVPNNDPTLMFANSGMVQFKNVFTGLEKRDYQRATTSQKCVRAGGKHNDLENVGYTPRHHTFFEMLGNFSFGDYFKEKAIHYAWDLITKDFGIDKNRLYVTVFHEDDEAFNFWKKIAGLSDDRILKISTGAAKTALFLLADVAADPQFQPSTSYNNEVFTSAGSRKPFADVAELVDAHV